MHPRDDAGGSREARAKFVGEGDEGGKDSLELGLEVAVAEGLDEDVGDEEGEDEVEDGGEVVFVAVVQAPFVDEDVEGSVFDVPAVVAELCELVGGKCGLGCGGGPGVVVRFEFRCGRRWDRAGGGDGEEDAEGLFHFGIDVDTLDVPILNRSAGGVPSGRFDLGGEGLGLGEKCGVVVLQSSGGMFLVFGAEVEEWAREIFGVADDAIEDSAVVVEDSFQEPVCSRQFSFARSEQFQVKGESDPSDYEVEDHAGVVVFGDLAVVNFDRASEATVAVPLPAGKKTRGRR